MQHDVIDKILNGLGEMGSDVKARLRTELQRALANQGLVTAETFETQKQVLLRTRQKLEALEKRLTDLEAGQR